MMIDLTRQEKQVLAVLCALAVLGLAVLAYRTYVARPKLSVVRAGEGCSEGRKPAAVNINKASASQIESLPGIGPKLAGQIVDYRERNGFLLKEDLKKVKGLGGAKYEAIKDLIVLE